MGLWIRGTVYKEVKLKLEHESRVDLSDPTWKINRSWQGQPGVLRADPRGPIYTLAHKPRAVLG